MNDYKLDLSALEKAIKQLEKSLSFSASDLAKQDLEIFQQFRASSIQSFEYTFEIAIKMIRRQLELIESSSELVDQLSFKDLIRTAAERGLLNDPLAWFAFRERRNITSHTYDEKKAEQVFTDLPKFLSEARNLLEKLHERNK
jgi:nucleotidyltransferase substrate binding protein (TIGR01987 family)